MENTKTSGIVAKIMTILNLGEEGKVGSFFNGLEKHYTSSITELEHNLQSLELRYASDSNKLQDSLTDAKEDLENAWLQVDVEKIQTREDQRNYIKVYNNNISRATAVVEGLEDDLEKLDKSHNTAIEDINNQITEYKARLAKIK
jgi:DNA repair exonuclease SbcCD ATPase subunit